MLRLMRSDVTGFLKSLRNLPFLAGAVIAVLGVGQLVFFLLLDKLGVVEVGNALGHGLLMVVSAPIALPLLCIGLRNALRNSGDPFPGSSRRRKEP